MELPIKQHIEYNSFLHGFLLELVFLKCFRFKVGASSFFSTEFDNTQIKILE